MTEQRTHKCPACGAAMDGSDTGALCPACLLSQVLRQPPGVVETEASTIMDIAGESETIAQVPGSDTAVGAGPRLPADLGGYTLLSLLGQGGMGTVYEAVQRSTGRRLAIKLLSQPLDTPEMRSRFLREGRLAARVSHPCSLYVFGSEEIEGVPAITMEISEGGTLQDMLNKRGPFAVQQAVDAVLNIIDGLEAADRQGVLHRDIKPSNCFVSADGTVKIGDFGLSVSTLPAADSFITQSGKVMGTPAFASPEQLRGDDVDARSDIYSVGATLFTLLTAQAPFRGDNAVQVVANVIDTPPAPVSRFREDLPQGLGSVISRCFAKEASGRYADYAALRDALLPFSSVVPEPATQAQRTAAGWIDFLLAFLPTYAALMITVGPEALFIRPLYEFTFAAWWPYLLVFAVGFSYFALIEGVWGTGLGKWVMNLRVVRRNGRAPGVGRALLRIIVPIATIECVRLPLTIATMPEGEWSSFNVFLLIGLSVFCPWVVAFLWIPAKRGNGFATAWDIVSGTRVVVRPRGTRRPASADTAAENVAASDRSRCIGPFRVVSEIEPGRWLLADDPVLRRRVWLMRGDGDGMSEARRAAARPGRARWLQEIRENGGTWEAFEAAHGTPLSEQVARGPVPWSTVRYWIHDLAAELWGAQRDGTLPAPCGLDHVWITDDGRAMLLDSPWPHASGSDEPGEAPVEVDSLEGQQRFLGAVADHADALSVPLHARPALHNLRSASFEKLTFLTGTFRGLLGKPADVHRGLRAASLFVIPGYAWIASFLGIATNTDPSVGPLAWAGRAAVAGLVMMHFIALFDIALAFWGKSAGLTTFGLEPITAEGKASKARVLARSLLMWLPVLAVGTVLGVAEATTEQGADPMVASALSAVLIFVAGVFAVSAMLNPTRGLHDRLAGVWIGRR